MKVFNKIVFLYQLHIYETINIYYFLIKISVKKIIKYDLGIIGVLYIIHKYSKVAMVVKMYKYIFYYKYIVQGLQY